ncbi:sugar ABC transporter permease [Ruania alkalisoli]|uniref:Sugar ABC transporter permease n=1 Tax=Ruania alkalisoli TaxID=2779775 RepID=A0A7M1SXS5_9MICO|nr:sugar ABC transporter permease [Ruania alkalisoli]QOR71433.1 sugar ABC transporter permease [Ruania alkalisoli]
MTQTISRSGRRAGGTAAPSGSPPATGRKPWRRRDRAIASVAVLPLLLPFVLFALVPIGYVVYLSFTKYNGVLDPVWVGLSNYEILITDTVWWRSVRNTLIFGAGSVVFEIPLALGLALLLNRRVRFGGGFRAIFFIPNVVSIAVIGIVFYFLLRPVDGVINGLLSWTGLVPEHYDWLGSGPSAMASLIAIGVWSGFGVNTVFFLVGLQTIPKEVVESATLDGATGWKHFWHITLPLLAPILRVVIMLTIIFTMRSFDIVKTLTDGGPAGQTEVMFTYLFGYFFSLDRGAQYGYASALAVVASIIIAIISLIYMRFSRDGGSR